MVTIKRIRLSRTKFFLTIIYSLSCLICRSQDIKMGYMQIKWLFGYTYADTTFVLTDINTNVNRPYILTNWGVKIDTSRLVQTTLTDNGYLKKYYGICTYPGPGNYLISWQDSSRIGNIINILNSNNQRIKLSTLLSIPNFGSPSNSGPILNNFDIKLSVQNDSVVFKPNFIDVNGDSLSFQLTPCFASNYYTPNGVSIDNYGNVSFSKDSIGIYAFSLNINEWRDDGAGSYFMIQSSQLDFTINITTDVFVIEKKDQTFALYPNPTNSIINIIDESNQLQNATIQIQNNLGQVVFKTSFKEQIDISHLSSGMYFLSIEDKGIKTTRKFVKE